MPEDIPFRRRSWGFSPPGSSPLRHPHLEYRRSKPSPFSAQAATREVGSDRPKCGPRAWCPPSHRALVRPDLPLPCRAPDRARLLLFRAMIPPSGWLRQDWDVRQAPSPWPPGSAYTYRVCPRLHPSLRTFQSEGADDCGELVSLAALILLDSKCCFAEDRGAVSAPDRSSSF